MAPDFVSSAESRLADFRRLFVGPRFDSRAYFSSFPAWLPFRVGDSAAESVIPYAFSTEIIEVAERAAAELIDLFKRRKEGELRLEVAILLAEQPRRLGPVRHFPGRLAEGSFLHGVADRALRLDPMLDAALLETWLSRGAPASRLVELVYALVSKALETDLGSGASLPYLYVIAIALTDLVEQLKHHARSAQIKSFSYDRMDKAFGLAFFALFATAIERLLEDLPQRQLPFEHDSYVLRVRLALNPLLYLSIRKSVLINQVNPYGVPSELAEVLDPVYAELIEQDPDPKGIERRLVFRLTHDRFLGEATEAAGEVALVREAIRGYLARFDAFDEALSAELAQALLRDDELRALKLRGRDVLARIAGLSMRKLSDPEAVALRDLRTLFRGEVDRADFLLAATQGFLALVFDRFAAEHLDAARARLRNRRAEHHTERLETEYTSGKLYRFGGDTLPFLRSLARASQGHLFIDLKGFSQRSYRAKEVVMAEFLRDEFYAPILRSAGKHLRPTTDAGPSLNLQNLLSDAAVFSGDVRALLSFAQDVQQILAAYAEKLKARTANLASEAKAKQLSVMADAEEKEKKLEAEEKSLDAELTRKHRLPAEKQEEQLWDLYARRLFALEKRRTEAELAGLGAEIERQKRAETVLRAERSALEDSLEMLVGDDRRAHIDEHICAPERARKAEIRRERQSLQENTRVVLRALEDEAKAASGQGLEAGLFITYGTAAEVVEFDDPAFGRVKLAISEKLTEAARGTARSSHIRAKLEALVERTRIRLRNPKLELPFCVYVDQTYSAVFSPELTSLVDAAVNEHSLERAREAGRLLAEGLARDVDRMAAMPGNTAGAMLTVINDIYNVGEALSEEAVEAYLRDTRALRFSFRKGLGVNELHPSFRERFCFSGEALEFHVSIPGSGELGEAVVFRFSGHVHFRGFEAKRATGVYELLRREGAFFKLLVQHHLKDWLNEARAAAKG
jgi:hypothetical protein